MRRAYKAGAVDSAPDGGLTSEGYPSEGDVTQGTLPTTPGPGWYYRVTEAICSVIEQAGMVLSDAPLQFRDAIVKLIDDKLAAFRIAPIAPSVTLSDVGTPRANNNFFVEVNLQGGVYDSLAYSWSAGSATTTIVSGQGTNRVEIRESTNNVDDRTLTCVVTCGGNGTNTRDGVSTTASATATYDVRAAASPPQQPPQNPPGGNPPGGNPPVELPNASAPTVSLPSISSVDEGVATAITASVSGGTYDSLTYSWSASGGTISGSGATVTFRGANTQLGTNASVRCRVTAGGDGTTAKAGTSDTASDTENFYVNDTDQVQVMQ